MKLYKLLSVLIISMFLATGCTQSRVKRIGVSQCSSDDWRAKMNGEIEREMMFHSDAEVEIRSADDDSRKQIEDIRYFVDNQFDIIIVAPNEAESLTPVIKEVYEKGIPVVIFDRDINGDTYTAHISANNTGLGRLAGRYAAQLVAPPVNVIEIKGLMGSTPAVERHKGFAEVADSIVGMTIVDGASAEWDMEKAVPLVDSLLRLHPETNLIYAHNDRMAIGASQAARALGRDDIRIIGIDAAPGIGIRAVADSVIDATFLYPTNGEAVIRRAFDILEGRDYPREEMLPLTSAVDRSNADILLLQDKELNAETERMKLLKKQVDKYWETHSAQNRLFYGLLCFAVVMAVVVFLLLKAYWVNKRHRLILQEKNRLLAIERDKQKVLNRQLAEATQSKLAFFTNVSHDLRTPLTLIADPVRQLAAASNLTPQQHTLMQLADKNVRILMRLINQVLDFRKYEAGCMAMNLTEADLRDLMASWFESFTHLARKRHIKFTVSWDEASDYRMAVDTEKIERVIFNLLANAFKYTPDNGSINVSASVSDGKLVLLVADTGIGISSAEIDRVFDNFYQAEKVRPNGSGIGLWLSRSFVEMHDGTITITSRQGEGSLFRIELPVKHVETPATDARPLITPDEVEAELSVIDDESVRADDDSRPLVLVIDDNPDMRLLLTSLLGGEYRVIRASNGREGLRMAVKYVPDLIICDVMMPGMEGTECCRLLKEEVSTSHIPVLMLTACALDEDRIKGYARGADGYLPKPFNSDVLKARVGNLIENRRRIRDLYSHGDGLTPPQPVHDAAPAAPSTSAPASDIDSEFYNRFLKIVGERMSNADLSVDMLASEMGLGRSQFYRKIKALTNYSPVELLRNLRLQAARRMVTSTEKTISEIAYETGFSTPAYFTKCFRDAFGATPTELRSRMG